MAETIQKGDFITLDYTAKTADGVVFDTTLASVAQEAGLQVQKPLKPIAACLGEGHLLRGLDRQLVGKAIGGSYTLTITPEEGFGKKNAKLLQLIPRKVFREQKVQPVPGLEITVDQQPGVIRSVSGGRIIVDFNHPLAGKDLIYEVHVLKKLSSLEDQVGALLEILQVPFKVVSLSGEGVSVMLGSSLPESITSFLEKEITRLTTAKKVSFVVEGVSVGVKGPADVSDSKKSGSASVSSEKNDKV